MPSTTTPTKCADCHENDGIHEIRKRHLCSDCFSRYVNSKILKRMESYRIKNQSNEEKKRLFLPLSGGISSLVLLSVLDAQLQKQTSKQGRTAYDLVISHISDPTTQATDTEWYTRLSSRYSTHTFLPPSPIYTAFINDPIIESALANLNITRRTSISDQDFYTHIISAATTPTTRNDLATLIRTRLITSLAHQHSCTSILYAHSDTRLASLSLSAVAKGRGGAVPSTIADGYSAAHDINLNYPCRDLFRTELELYGSLLPEPLLGVDKMQDAGQGQAGRVITSMRSTSIDELLAGYITSQGEKYPSIMANVVRTAGKLQREETGVEHEARYCVLCRGLVVGNQEQGDVLCYGCVRMKQDIRVS